MNTIDTTTATTAELLAFYNANSGKAPVARFADRKTAERRVGLLLVEMRAAAETAEDAKRGGPATSGAARPERETGDDRCVSGFEQHGLTNCPHCDVHLSNGVMFDGDETHDERGRKKLIKLTHEFECMGCGGGFGKKLRGRGPRGASNNGNGVALSWLKSDVRNARCERHSVTTTDSKGKTLHHKSVPQAFIALGITDGLVKFRKELKAAKKLERFGYVWQIAEG